jgi:hypothetical protein
MVEASLDTIHAFTIKHERPTEDELTIQRLGIRLFNAEASALSLLLAGYYQNSVTLQRRACPRNDFDPFFLKNLTDRLTDLRLIAVREQLLAALYQS